MEQTKKLPLFDDFCNDLKKSLATSADSYISYLNSQIKILEDNQDFDLAKELSLIDSADNLHDVLNLTIMALETADIKRGTLANYKSALRKYFGYLESHLLFAKVTTIDDGIQKSIANNGNTFEEKNNITSFKRGFCITHDELYNTFKNRLLTDDRFKKEGNIYIPMRLINSILMESEQKHNYQKWVKSTIENTIVLTDRGCTHLRNIIGICLTDRPYFSVHFRLDCAEPARLFTYTSKPGIIIPYPSYSVDRFGIAYNLKDKNDVISDMTREHYPESSIMAMCKSTDFKALPIITNICKKYAIGNGTQLQYAISHNASFMKDIHSAINVNDLYEDLLLIDSYQSVTLMKKSMNIKKGGTNRKIIINPQASFGTYHRDMITPEEANEIERRGVYVVDENGDLIQAAPEIITKEEWEKSQDEQLDNSIRSLTEMKEDGTITPEFEKLLEILTKLKQNEQ